MKQEEYWATRLSCNLTLALSISYIGIAILVWLYSLNLVNPFSDFAIAAPLCFVTLALMIHSMRIFRISRKLKSQALITQDEEYFTINPVLSPPKKIQLNRITSWKNKSKHKIILYTSDGKTEQLNIKMLSSQSKNQLLSFLSENINHL